MKIIGNGRKLTYKGQLVITGNSLAIPNAFTSFCKVDFPNLVFEPSFDGLLTFDENSGVFEFLQRGYLKLSANINFDSIPQPERLEVTLFRDQGAGYIALGSSSVDTNVLIKQQLFFIIPMTIEKGDKIKFEIKSNGNGCLDTEILSNGSMIPAARIDFELHNR
jgi:hypothetical protein